jgi:hypothetical protein
MKRILVFLALALSAFGQTVQKTATTTYVDAAKAAAISTAAGDATTKANAAAAASVPTSRTVNGHALSGDVSVTLADVGAAPAFTFGALVSNTITLGGITTPYPTRDYTWSSSPQTLTIANIAYTAGQAGTVNIHATVPVTLTISAAGGTVYRNGSTSALGATTIAIPVGNHTFRVWTPDTGATLYIDDTVFGATDIPLTDAGSYFTTDNVEAALQQLGAGGSGTDANAIHVNASGEINGLTNKPTPTTSDLLVIEDAAALNAKKKVTTAALPVSTATQAALDAKASITYVDAQIAGVTAGAVPVGTGGWWVTSDLANLPTDWLAADGTNGTPTVTGLGGGVTPTIVGAGTVPTPTFSPPAGSYSSAQTVTISYGTATGQKYSVDGVTTPSRSAGSTYTSALTVSTTQTVQAMGYIDGPPYYKDSTVAPAAYTISATTYALDAISTSAYAAYSLRKLRSAYTGSAIRVRRASDNTEQDIGFSGEDLDTTSLAAFCSGTDGFVVTRYDQTTNGRNQTQATTTAQPKIVSAGTVILDSHSHAKVSLDGVDDTMATSALSPTLPISIFAVVTNASFTSLDIILSGNSTSRTALKQNTGSKFLITSGANLSSTTTLTTGTQYVATAYFESGTSDSIRVNAGTALVGDAGSNAPTALVLGSATLCPLADVSEDIWFNASLTTLGADEATLRNNVNAYYILY